METQIKIPIYRGLKLGTENEYVIGFLLQDCFGFYIIQTDNALRCETLNREAIEIDHQTLSISFSDMLDSKGNKIFASLQEDGKGGDIMQDDEYFGIAKYKDCQFVVEYEDCIDNIDNGNFEVIGIQK